MEHYNVGNKPKSQLNFGVGINFQNI